MVEDYSGLSGWAPCTNRKDLIIERGNRRGVSVTERGEDTLVWGLEMEEGMWEAWTSWKRQHGRFPLGSLREETSLANTLILATKSSYMWKFVTTARED